MTWTSAKNLKPGDMATVTFTFAGHFRRGEVVTLKAQDTHTGIWIVNGPRHINEDYLEPLARGLQLTPGHAHVTTPAKPPVYPARISAAPTFIPGPDTMKTTPVVGEFVVEDLDTQLETKQSKADRIWEALHAAAKQ